MGELGYRRSAQRNQLECRAVVSPKIPGGTTILNAQRIKRGLQLPALGLRALHTSRMVGDLSRLHLTSREPVIGAEGPVVSLTSYGKRIETVHLTIESIARGSLRPSRLILWLDERALFESLPDSLLRLQQRGLEVCLANAYGPHTKYYPYLETCGEFARPLVTADDDILYPRYWLERLARANVERPDLVNCFRARVISFQKRELAPYEEWQMCQSTAATIRHLATGVSGVIYSPVFLALLKRAGAGFTGCCPKADDLWLHVQALRAGYRVRQIVKEFLDFPIIPDTQHMALQNYNRGAPGSGNDRQAAITYNRSDLDVLMDSDLNNSQENNPTKGGSDGN